MSPESQGSSEVEVCWKSWSFQINHLFFRFAIKRTFQLYPSPSFLESSIKKPPRKYTKSSSKTVTLGEFRWNSHHILSHPKTRRTHGTSEVTESITAKYPMELQVLARFLGSSFVRLWPVRSCFRSSMAKGRASNKSTSFSKELDWRCLNKIMGWQGWRMGVRIRSMHRLSRLSL